MSEPGPAMSTSAAPPRAGLVLASLILAAAVCNINLGVANIALPDIARRFDASQTTVNLVAIATTLGLAMSVLWFGAIGDRYGRKRMLTAGLALTVPVSLLAAFAPSIEVLIIARLATGLAAGMAYPTTLAIVTALWADGPGRTRAIALWSGVSAGTAAIGPVIAGLLLAEWWWGSVFLIAVPPAVVALFAVLRTVPAGANESTDPIDHLGGALSLVAIALLVGGISILGSPGLAGTGGILLVASSVVWVVFFWRQRRTPTPLYDLTVARRRLFWVPGVAGLIAFGSLMGSLFVGQQFLQNVFGYSTIAAGFAILPSAFGLFAASPLAARLITGRGSRTTMLVGYALLAVSFALMVATWRPGAGYLVVGLAYAILGAGAGMALAPASRLLTGSTPVRRVGMASGTADLQRDLGGAIMQALLGAMLSAGYAAAFAKQITGAGANVTDDVKSQLLASYASAEDIAKQFPQYTDAIVSAARSSFESGSLAAFGTAFVAVVIAGLLVRLGMPGRDGEDALAASYAAADAAADPGTAATSAGSAS